MLLALLAVRVTRRFPQAKDQSENQRQRRHCQPAEPQHRPKITAPLLHANPQRQCQQNPASHRANPLFAFACGAMQQTPSFAFIGERQKKEANEAQ
jgi:hypothetical protein